MGKYKRNSGLKKEAPKPKNKKKDVVLSKEAENKLLSQLIADAKWVAELSELKQFSKEWAETVLLEVMLQCMGKKDIVTTNMFGQQIAVRMFKEKGALTAVSTLAKMNGHLFDTVKGNITKTVEGSVEHNHVMKPEPDANRTIEVLNILESCGALQPETKQLSDSEVEQVHSA